MVSGVKLPVSETSYIKMQNVGLALTGCETLGKLLTSLCLSFLLCETGITIMASI